MSREHNRWSVVRPSLSWGRRGTLLLIFLLTGVCSLPLAEARDVDCESAEACFQRAASSADKQPDQVDLLVERFRHVQEAYPGNPLVPACRDFA